MPAQAARKLASLRLIKKIRGACVRATREGGRGREGDYLRTHGLMASFNKNYRPDNFTRAAGLALIISVRRR